MQINWLTPSEKHSSPLKTTTLEGKESRLPCLLQPRATYSLFLYKPRVNNHQPLTTSSYAILKT